MGEAAADDRAGVRGPGGGTVPLNGQWSVVSGQRITANCYMTRRACPIDRQDRQRQAAL